MVPACRWRAVVGQGWAARTRQRRRIGRRRGLLDRGRKGRTLGWETTRRTDPAALGREFDSRPRPIPKPTGSLRTASIRFIWRRDGTVWAGTLSARREQAQRRQIHELYDCERAGVEHRCLDSRRLRRNDVVCDAERLERAVARATGKPTRPGDGLPSENVNCLWRTRPAYSGSEPRRASRSANPEDFEFPPECPRPLREQILGLAEDRYGSLWMATSNHVLRVNRESSCAGALADGDVREYGLADGLRGLEGVKRHRSVVTDPAGGSGFP